MSSIHADQFTLETPENIEVNFELAGLGTRFCATLIDWTMIALIILMLLLINGILGLRLWPSGDQRATSWVFAVIVGIIIAILSGGYFLIFELLMRGQTPGKRSMKIRVIRDDGTPAGANEILIRNILRLIDFLPLGYGLGAIVMFPNSMCKRLGDIAAGTVVVKEGQLDYTAAADKKKSVLAEPVDVANAELTVDERRLVVGFLQRRAELLPLEIGRASCRERV